MGCYAGSSDDLHTCDSGSRLTPEKITTRWQELEDARRCLEREQAKLDAAAKILTGARVCDLGQRIETNTDGYPLFDLATQCVAAAALLTRQLPPSSTPEERRVQSGLKSLLERATVQQAESSTEQCFDPELDTVNSRSPSPADPKG